MLWEFIKWSPDGKRFDLQTNSLNLFFKEMYGDQSWEFVFGYWGLEGLCPKSDQHQCYFQEKGYES